MIDLTGFHVLITHQLMRRQFADDDSLVNHIGIVRCGASQSNILLNQQDGYSFLLQLSDDSRDFLHDDWRQTFGGLIH